MASKVYALTIGINEYLGGVSALKGCEHDADRFEAYLKKRFTKNLEMKSLRSSGSEKPTRENVIAYMNDFLTKATADDVAVLFYGGHGAQNPSAAEFKKYFPDGKDEGIVLQDSREDGKYDLADKEFAMLLHRIAKNNPHLVLILDSCHSGSATRDVDEFNQLVPRFSAGRKEPRPLESYLDGAYQKILDKDKSKNPEVIIPGSKHILLAACDRAETAKEDPTVPSGIFTEALMSILENSKQSLTYKDIFVRCRSEVRKNALKQNPQFETFMGFNANAGFLGGEAASSERFMIHYEKKKWRLAHGSIYGLPNDPSKSTQLEIYTEQLKGRSLGGASTTVVGPTESEIEFTGDFEGEIGQEYWGEVTDIPLEPMVVFLDAGKSEKTAIEKAVAKNRKVHVAFTDDTKGVKYGLIAKDNKITLKQLELDMVVQYAKGTSDASAEQIVGVLEKVIHWERTVNLQNAFTKIDGKKISFNVRDITEGNDNFIFNEDDFDNEQEITIDFDPAQLPEDAPYFNLNFEVTNKSGQELFFTLLHFSDVHTVRDWDTDETEKKGYGIKSYYNYPPIKAGKDPVTLEVGLDEDNPNNFSIWLDDADNENIDIFKLIVSTEKVDDFLFETEEIGLDVEVSSSRAGGAPPKGKKMYKNEWFTKTIRLKTVRKLDQVGKKDVALANNKIKIKGHPSIKADLSLSAAKTNSRSVSAGSGIYEYLENRGMEMVNFAGGTRDADGNDENILEISDLPQDVNDTLADNPLEMELDMKLKDDEQVLPMAFDGEHIWLIGDVDKGDDGKTNVSIDYVPDIPDNRRSLGKALKMYFFKTYLKQDNPNQLCWVDYKDDGSVERKNTGLASKVKDAKNVLLCVHGIIGDTEIIAKGLRDAKDADGKTLDQKFDLVLTYDYENLSTLIDDTAKALKTQLETAGFGPNDDKKLTVLAHSMGGLVSRCFIEQNGGNGMVDHLVMCGTPNVGSPFGMVDKGRKLLGTLATLSINTVPMIAPFALTLLNRSKKITKTLEQMNPTSDFIKGLNGSGDPCIRYTILAGEAENYDEPSDKLFPQLFNKLAKSGALRLLFSNQSHDIAVQVDSILGVDSNRNPAPVRNNVACHHLNYFSSETGLAALKEVEW